MVTKNFVKLFASISLITVFVDQILKYIISLYTPNISLGILNIHLVKNTGAGFGILQGQTILLGIISLLVSLLIIFFYHKIPQEKWVQALFAFFLGGVVGNGIDRLFRNAVIDFIDFGWWPAFNIADMAISIAGIGLVVYYMKNG